MLQKQNENLKNLELLMSNSAYIAKITEAAWKSIKEVLHVMRPYLIDAEPLTEFGKNIYVGGRSMAYMGAEFASQAAQKGAETAADLAFDAADLASDVAKASTKMAKDIANTGKDLVGDLGDKGRELYSSMKEGFARVGF